MRIAAGILLAACSIRAGHASGPGNVYTVPPEDLPTIDMFKRLQAGETVNLLNGGSLEGFEADFGSVINVYGGVIHPGSHFSGEVNVYGGVVKEFTSFESSSVVNVFAGQLTGGNTLWGGMNLRGGNHGGSLDALAGSILNVAGGSIDSGVNSRGIVNLTAGSVGSQFTLLPGGVMSIRASMAFLNGAPIPGLLAGETVTVSQRGDFTLSGELGDGTAFDFDLNDDSLRWLNEKIDYFDPTALLQITLVPEPAGVTMLGLGVFVALGSRRCSRLKFLRWR
jgi:hypothetical protein